MDIAQERVDAAVRSILSGNTSCGTLANALAAGDGEYFRLAIQPLAAVYEEEAAALRKQRDDALRDAENKRFALESIVANMDIPAGAARDAVIRVMGDRRF